MHHIRGQLVDVGQVDKGVHLLHQSHRVSRDKGYDQADVELLVDCMQLLQDLEVEAKRLDLFQHALLTDDAVKIGDKTHVLLVGLIG